MIDESFRGTRVGATPTRVGVRFDWSPDQDRDDHGRFAGAGLGLEAHKGEGSEAPHERFATVEGPGEIVRPAGWKANNEEADKAPNVWNRNPPATQRDPKAPFGPPIEVPPTHLYRGMTEVEFEAHQKAGFIKSNGAYSHESEGTSYARDPSTAEGYANYGRDDPRTTGRPTYLVEIPNTSQFKRWDDGYYKTPDKIPLSQITRAWKMTAENDAIVARRLVNNIEPTRLDDWDEARHPRDDHGRFGEGLSPEQKTALEAFPKDSIFKGEESALHATERVLLADIMMLPEESKYEHDRNEGSNRKTEAESKEESRVYDALTPVQREALGKYSKGYDVAIRMLDRGLDPQKVSEITEKHWNDQAHLSDASVVEHREIGNLGMIYKRESASSTGGEGHTTGAEHTAVAQGALTHIQTMFHTVAPSPGVAYRGLNVPSEMAAKILNSKSLTLDSMASFTNELRTAQGFTNNHDSKTNYRPESLTPHGVQIVMHVSQKSGINTNGMSKFRAEREVLVPKGTQFKINSIIREKSLIDTPYSRMKSYSMPPRIIVNAEEI